MKRILLSLLLVLCLAAPCLADKIPLCKNNRTGRFSFAETHHGEFKCERHETLIMINTVGPKGDKGDTGEQGIQGLQGDKGDKGDQGIQGVAGSEGLPGEPGVDGENCIIERLFRQKTGPSAFRKLQVSIVERILLIA